MKAPLAIMVLVAIVAFTYKYYTQKPDYYHAYEFCTQEYKTIDSVNDCLDEYDRTHGLTGFLNEQGQPIQ